MYFINIFRMLFTLIYIYIYVYIFIYLTYLTIYTIYLYSRVCHRIHQVLSYHWNMEELR